MKWWCSHEFHMNFMKIRQVVDEILNETHTYTYTYTHARAHTHTYTRT